MDAEAELEQFNRWRKIPPSVLTTMIVEAFARRGISPRTVVAGGRSRFLQAMRSDAVMGTLPPYVEAWSVADIADVYDRIAAIAESFTDQTRRNDVEEAQGRWLNRQRRRTV